MATQLVHLPDVERLSSRVIRILGGNPGKFTLQGTNTYLLGTGPQRLLIDTGEGRPHWNQTLSTLLTSENASITAAIITHWHHDHVGGITDLQSFSPSTKIYKNQASSEQHQIELEDGQEFRVDGASLKAVFTPGHAQDHMAFYLQEEDALFTGDNVLGQGTAVFEDLGTYLSSLEKMKGVFNGRAYPGHGPIIEDGPAKITEYVRHRKMREDQVVQVLKGESNDGGKVERMKEGSRNAGEWTSMEIVKVIYKDVPEDLHLPANGGILQILRKLEEEGKVVEDGRTERWRLKGKAAL